MIPAADFAPGTILGDRYRIVSLLGRGALKFLPRQVSDHPARVAQRIREVRIRRTGQIGVRLSF